MKNTILMRIALGAIALMLISILTFCIAGTQEDSYTYVNQTIMGWGAVGIFAALATLITTTAAMDH